MKNLYVIDIEMDEMSVYFADLTDSQAKTLRSILKKGPWNFKIQKIRGGPGYNSFKDLEETFADMVTP